MKAAERSSPAWYREPSPAAPYAFAMRSSCTRARSFTWRSHDDHLTRARREARARHRRLRGHWRCSRTASLGRWSNGRDDGAPRANDDCGCFVRGSRRKHGRGRETRRVASARASRRRGHLGELRRRLRRSDRRLRGAHRRRMATRARPQPPRGGPLRSRTPARHDRTAERRDRARHFDPAAAPALRIDHRVRRRESRSGELQQSALQGGGACRRAGERGGAGHDRDGRRATHDRPARCPARQRRAGRARGAHEVTGRDSHRPAWATRGGRGADRVPRLPARSVHPWRRDRDRWRYSADHLAEKRRAAKSVARNAKGRPRGSDLPRMPSEPYCLRTFCACSPFGPFTISNSTLSPSASERNPSAWMAVWWTNTSSPPSCEMKPNPLLSLNHFTVPCAMKAFFSLRTVTRPVHGGSSRRVEIGSRTHV